MPTILRLALVVPVLAQVACFDDTAVLERRLERSFEVQPGSSVRVELAGGAITVLTGAPGRVHVAIRQAVHTNDGETAANRVLSDYLVNAAQDGREVLVVGRRKSLVSWMPWGWHRVRLSATITAPPDVALSLGTSGGRITVRGDRTASIRASTSGGSVAIDGGGADVGIRTSGGSIRVARALGRLSADTSGGSISVDYLARTAEAVVLSTSGGSIRIGVDPAGSFALDAGTSGGSVSVEDLAFDAIVHGRSHARGTINGGAHPLRLTTSGGSITVRPATDAGRSVGTNASR